MAHAAFASLGSSLPVAEFVAAGLAFVWFCIALTFWYAARRLSMPAVAGLGMLGTVGIALVVLGVTADRCQP